MSDFYQTAKHPKTGEVELAQWIDDYFGPHQYGVRFQDGTVFHADRIELAAVDIALT